MFAHAFNGFGPESFKQGVVRYFQIPPRDLPPEFDSPNPKSVLPFVLVVDHKPEFEQHVRDRAGQRREGAMRPQKFRRGSYPFQAGIGAVGQGERQAFKSVLEPTEPGPDGDPQAGCPAWKSVFSF